MTPTSSQAIINLFKLNHGVIQDQVNGITQEESLIQPPFRGNCMNWVIGHILGVQGDILELLGLPGTMTEAEEKVYGYGSDPLTGCENAQDLQVMLIRLDVSLETIVSKLGSLSPAELESQVEMWMGKVTLIEGISFMQWHESYHTGQLELLRQLAGKNDKVI